MTLDLNLRLFVKHKNSRRFGEMSEMKTPPPGRSHLVGRRSRRKGLVRAPDGSVGQQPVTENDQPGDNTENQFRDRVVLEFGQATDRTGQRPLSERHNNSTALREVTPGEATVLIVRLHYIPEEIPMAAEPEVQRIEAEQLLVIGVTKAQQGTKLAHRIGDVPLTLRSPAPDKKDELLRLIPEIIGKCLVLVNRPHHGETEAWVVSDQAYRCERLDGIAVAFENSLQVDLGAIPADICLLGWQSGHVQQLAGHVKLLVLWCSYREFYPHEDD